MLNGPCACAMFISLGLVDSLNLDRLNAMGADEFLIKGKVFDYRSKPLQSQENLGPCLPMIAMRGKLQIGQRTVVSGSISPESKSAFLGRGVVFQKRLVS